MTSEEPSRLAARLKSRRRREEALAFFCFSKEINESRDLDSYKIGDFSGMLGIHHLLPYGDFTDRGVGVTGLALEVELHRLFKISHGLLTLRAEAGDIHVETLSHDEFVFAIDAVCHCFLGKKMTFGPS